MTSQALVTVSPTRALDLVDALIKMKSRVVDAMERAIFFEDSPSVVIHDMDRLTRFLRDDGDGSCFEWGILERDAAELRKVIEALGPRRSAR